MPGRKTLAAELGVNHKTCESALQLLEAEGLLIPQGKGLSRMIAKSIRARSAKIRVKVLLYEKSDVRTDYLVELLHRLREAGHEPSFAEKSMRGLGMSTERIARYVSSNEADAWIVFAGPRGVLDWFAQQPVPAFALFGRMVQVPMAASSIIKRDVVGELARCVGAPAHRLGGTRGSQEAKPRYP